MAIEAHLPLDERLSILRAADRVRNWSSLDDQRLCILYEKAFSGRQVKITRGRSGPSQWFYPGNSLISQIACRDWQRALEQSDSTPAAA